MIPGYGFIKTARPEALAVETGKAGAFPQLLSFETSGQSPVPLEDADVAFLREELKSVRDDYAYWYDIIALAGKACGNLEILAKYRVLAGSTTGNKRMLIKKQHQFYRSYLKLGVVQSIRNTMLWGISGIRKFTGLW